MIRKGYQQNTQKKLTSTSWLRIQLVTFIPLWTYASLKPMVIFLANSSKLIFRKALNKYVLINNTALWESFEIEGAKKKVVIRDYSLLFWPRLTTGWILKSKKIENALHGNLKSNVQNRASYLNRTICWQQNKQKENYLWLCQTAKKLRFRLNVWRKSA